MFFLISRREVVLLLLGAALFAASSTDPARRLPSGLLESGRKLYVRSDFEGVESFVSEALEELADEGYERTATLPLLELRALNEFARLNCQFRVSSAPSCRPDLAAYADALTPLIAEFPASAELPYLRARALGLLERFDESFALLDRVLALRSTHVPALTHYALLLRAHGEKTSTERGFYGQKLLPEATLQRIMELTVRARELCRDPLSLGVEEREALLSITTLQRDTATFQSTRMSLERDMPQRQNTWDFYNVLHRNEVKRWQAEHEFDEL